MGKYKLILILLTSSIGWYNNATFLVLIDGKGRVLIYFWLINNLIVF